MRLPDRSEPSAEKDRRGPRGGPASSPLSGVLTLPVSGPMERRVPGRLPGQALLKPGAGEPGVRVVHRWAAVSKGNSFWMVSDHGTASSYVKNIQAAQPRPP